jgi:hypothetical protein
MGIVIYGINHLQLDATLGSENSGKMAPVAVAFPKTNPSKHKKQYAIYII